MSMLLGIIEPMVPLAADANSTIVEDSDIPLRLWYDEEASHGVDQGYEDMAEAKITYDGSGTEKFANDDWERWSLPIGNGYIGANVFGRTETERIQITEKTLANPYYRYDENGTRHSLGALNNFSETYIDFGHTNSEVTNYSRWLDLKTGISGVSYKYNGVNYTREYFTSYPAKALVIRLDADKSGALDFTLRPTVPWKQDYAAFVGDGASKTGSVTSKVTNGVGEIELSGKMGYYDIDFLGLYKVYTDGGTVTAKTAEHTYTDTAKKSHTDINGTIEVKGAKSAYIVVTCGTDYELTTDVFTSADDKKPTFNRDLGYTRTKVQGYMNDVLKEISGKSFDEAYNTLKNAHLDDYTNIFSRVTLDLGNRDDAELTTDKLLEKYKSGTYSTYLETLYFQYGRYLLISSSRVGALPANLQGAWNRYNYAPWSSGYWHNINVQMNYWPAFNTNIAETFESYMDYAEAFMPAAEANASSVINQYYKQNAGLDGGDGWCIAVDAFVNEVRKDRSAGNLGLTTQLYWEYYDFTRDPEIREEVYDILVNAARFITKIVEYDEESGKYLVSYCDSPEVHHNGIWYYTKGTTYAQTFAYVNNYNALTMAKELGIDLNDSELLSQKEYSVLKTIMEQLDLYDPTLVGLSGQIKEFREEDYYSSIGDDPQHRHTAQLVGLYPANLINSTTPAWLDAAMVSLTERGDNTTGWGMAMRLNMWARTKRGDRTYLLLNNLLKTCTATNLWDLHPPFQIDGNLGGTAGIAEMLLQSHEGYIAPLPAIPSNWATGSYTGLVARGNFEVSAAWENGVAKTFNITSKVGGDASVYYGGITSAKVVRASDGKAVDYTVSGTDLITFPTEVGETYIISGFKLTEKLDAPASLTAERNGLYETKLSWDAVEGAVKYNVYTAIEHQPDYTLIETTTETTTVYKPSEENVNARTTYRVVPVNADGVEGDRVLAYENPITPVIDDCEAYILEDGNLQVTVNSSEDTKTYKLWRKAQGADDYTMVCESPYPVMIYDGYNSGDSYAISVVSRYGVAESKLYELTNIKKITDGIGGNTSVWNTNILEGMTFVPETEAASMIYNSDYGYNKLTDGIYDKDASGNTNKNLGRFATKDTTGMKLDGTVTFDSTHLFSEMRIYDQNTGKSTTRLGNELTVSVLSGNEWKTVVSIVGQSNIIAARKLDSEKGLYYLPVDLSGVKGEAIRVVLENEASSTQGITVYEITCSGAALHSGLSYNENLLDGKKPTASSSTVSVISGYELTKLTDGSFDNKNGRFALKDGTQGNSVTVEYDISEVGALDVLKIYDYGGSGESVSRVSSATVELYENGTWVKYYDAKPLLAPSERLSDSNGNKYTPIDLKKACAEKIRITLSNTKSTYGVTINEIMLGGLSETVQPADVENIFVGKEFIAADGAQIYGPSFPYSKLTDGVYDKDASGNTNKNIGRYASKDGKGAYLDGTIELDSVYILSEMRMYDYTTSSTATYLGDSVKVYAYYAGEWSEVYSLEGRESIAAAKKTDSITGLHYLPINISGVKAEAVRVYALNSTKDNQGITAFEITCSGTKTGEHVGKNALGELVSAKVDGTNFDIKNLIDGSGNTTYSIGTDAASYCMEFDLGANYGISTLNVRDVRAASDLVNGKAATRSNDTYIELYIDGEWVKVASGAALSTTETFTSFDLYGLSASKVRIGFNNTQTFDNGTSPAVVLSEMYLTISDKATDKSAMLEIYEKLDSLALDTDVHTEMMNKFLSYISKIDLLALTGEQYFTEMNGYYTSIIDEMKADLSFTPAMSLTLDRDLVMNVYVPTEKLVSFTLNGIPYTSLEGLAGNKVTVDSKEYYRMEVPLSATEAAKTVQLVANVSVADNTLIGTFTFSVPKYAEKLVASGNDIEVALIKDILSYIRAAYTYFDKVDEEAMSKIDTLLGKDYDASNVPALNGSTEAPSTGLKGVRYVLGSTPAIRFYITGDASSYAFYVNDEKLETVVENDQYGTYLEMDVYAYAMGETITYTIDGVESGSYHLNSYYNFLTTDEAYKDNAELINLVARFAKYCESAKAYRDYMLSEEYQMGIAPAKVKVTFDGGKVVNSGTDASINANTYVLNDTEGFTATDTVSYTIGKDGNTNGAIITNHLNGPYTVVEDYNFGTSDFTISTWFKLEDASVIVDKSGGYLFGTNHPDTGKGFSVVLKKSTEGVYQIRMRATTDSATGSSQFYDLTNTEIVSNTWYNVTIARVGAVINIYFNGKLVGEHTVSSYDFGTSDLAFGAYFGKTYYYDENTYFDDVKVYGVGLTTDQVQKLYTMNK